MTGSIAHVARTMRGHWPNYVMEAIELGVFMMSACLFSIFLFHPGSMITAMIESEWLRRLLMGVAMGATAVLIIYSPLGRRSGAHMNPAFTLALLRLGKVAPVDAVCYMLAQFAGGTLGVLLIAWLAGAPIAHESVNYAVTTPAGPSWRNLTSAWGGEFIISFILMAAALVFGNSRGVARFTGAVCGLLIASFILIESPVSGMSMNPARTYASAIAAHVWTGWWIYLTAPPLAMLLAADVYVRLAGVSRVYCAKWHHDHTSPCIFRCRFHELGAPQNDASRVGESLEHPHTAGVTSHVTH